MRRQMRKRYLSKKSFAYEIYAGTSKAAHNVFQQRWLKIGCVFHSLMRLPLGVLQDTYIATEGTHCSW